MVHQGKQANLPHFYEMHIEGDLNVGEMERVAEQRLRSTRNTVTDQIGNLTSKREL